jgi:deoxyribodipyrimidine photo-lyase
VASYQLWLDWRATGLVLARLFTDYEPGIHWPMIQMQAGTNPFTVPRIYNPVKQGLDQDPKGAFIRRWCPELQPVPTAFLHEPWRWDGAGRLEGRYPRPLVDLEAATRVARDAVFAAHRVVHNPQGGGAKASPFGSVAQMSLPL